MVINSGRNNKKPAQKIRSGPQPWQIGLFVVALLLLAWQAFAWLNRTKAENSYVMNPGASAGAAGQSGGTGAGPVKPELQPVQTTPRKESMRRIMQEKDEGR